MKTELPEELKIHNIEEVWSGIVEFLDKKNEPDEQGKVVDAGKLEHVDGAGLQLLFFLIRELSDGIADFTLTGLSSNLIDFFSSYGFNVSNES